MIIDAHGHIGPWENGEITPEYVIQLMDEAGINLSIISNLGGVGRYTDQNPPNQQTLQAVRSYPARLRGSVWVNPWKGELAIQNTRMCLELPGKEFVGLKFHPYLNAFHFNSEFIKPFVRLAQEFDAPLAVHTAYDEFSHPDEVVAVALQPEFKGAKFILYHAGLGAPDFESGEAVFRQVAQQNNLYIDISWLNMDRLKLALELIPIEQILYGTDVPLGGPDHYQEYSAKIAALELSKEERIKLMEVNARNIFKRL